MYSCTVVFNEIKSGFRNYTLCGRKNVPYVCCPEPIKFDPPINNIKIKQQFEDRNAKQSSARISEKKCSEYAATVYEKHIVNSLLPGEPVYRNVSTCGAKSIPLIINGKEAAPYEFPHMALLGYEEGHKRNIITWDCGGSLISERYVLTAAHCADDRVKVPKYVRLGEHNIDDESNDNDDPEDFEISEIILHPQFNENYNDIALLKLNREVKINKFKRPACLPRQYNSNSERAIATGWGFTSWAGKKSKYLQKVQLDITFDELYCQDKYKDKMKPINYEHQLCAGSKTDSNDTCQGDSGGPLQINSPVHRCMYEIIGITSVGLFCGLKNLPGIYTRVYSYVDWIENNVWKQAN